MGLEDKIDKIMVVSDIHVPYQDKRAVEIMHEFSKDYKPNKIYINGDLVDFYKLSTFDQDPYRKETVKDEVYMARLFLSELRKNNPRSNITFLHGNHENRLQRYLWRNPELDGLDVLQLKKLLDLDKYHIKEVSVDGDYWGKATGHVKQGDAIIMHGDNRLNGASTSKYAGYSVKNTMLNGSNQSVVMGHIHRGAVIHHSTPYRTLTGVEGGCLCKIPGTANWQQGFVTFETEKGKNHNYQFHHIEHGKLIEGKSKYPKKIWQKNQ